MCVVSNVGDYWRDRLPNTHPWINPNPTQPFLYIQPTREEFEQLKREIQELKLLLQAAMRYDEKTNQPHCEQEEKIALIKKLAEYVGVDLSDVFKTEEEITIKYPNGSGLVVKNGTIESIIVGNSNFVTENFTSNTANTNPNVSVSPITTVTNTKGESSNE